MKQFVAFSVLILIGIACSKDKFETKPQLKIESVSSKEVSNAEPLSVTLQYTDKEGDVSDTLFIVRQRLNARGPVLKDALPYKIPDFPNASKGEIRVDFRFFEDLILNLDPIRIPGSNPSRNESDSLRLKFVAKDKAGHTSDTLVLDDIIVERL